MHIVDANVLLYAVNNESELHLPAVGWLDAALAGGATVGFDWTVLLAFTRISTMSRVFDRPLSSGEALAQVRRWLDAPGSHVISPSSAHPEVVASLLDAAGRGGNLINDAHLAALAVENRAVIVSFDSDFERFPGVRWQRPEAGAGE
ncbi:MAG: type II toxin-antitoxin system VapC family toxin [Humibacillus sp.]|nr:type II toxin-antitoxin system VapC family toxin [Humibacillus sp.]MDN5778712.1 type II toxin-antitoxin system VapC family toxin [Humibacillus sp.]